MEFSFAILSRGFWFVKCFFENFSSSILKPLRPNRLGQTALLDYHVFPRLSSAFFDFFSNSTFFT